MICHRSNTSTGRTATQQACCLTSGMFISWCLCQAEKKKTIIQCLDGCTCTALTCPAGWERSTCSKHVSGGLISLTSSLVRIGRVEEELDVAVAWTVPRGAREMDCVMTVSDIRCGGFGLLPMCFLSLDKAATASLWQVKKTSASPLRRPLEPHSRRILDTTSGEKNCSGGAKITHALYESRFHQTQPWTSCAF